MAGRSGSTAAIAALVTSAVLSSRRVPPELQADTADALLINMPQEQQLSNQANRSHTVSHSPL